MQPKQFSIVTITLIVALIFCPTLIRGACYEGETQLQTFIARAEFLVLNSTDQALNATRSTYLSLSGDTLDVLQPEMRQRIKDYLKRVEIILGPKSSYTEKRALLMEFHQQSLQLEKQLENQHDGRQQLFPGMSYSANGEKDNKATDFDAVYLDFVHNFERASQQLWQQMPEQTVEKHEPLLELLDEISKESQLIEKDKLFDELIDKYLFKKCENNTVNA